MSKQFSISRGNKTTERVEGEEVVPGLFIHRMFSEGFGVSHVATGRGFGFRFRTEAGARSFVHAIKPLGNWESKDPIPVSERSEALCVLRDHARAINKKEDLAAFAEEENNKRLWCVSVTGEHEFPVWAAGKEEAEDIAVEEFFHHDESVDIVTDTVQMKAGHYLNPSRPYGRKDDLTCAEILEA